MKRIKILLLFLTLLISTYAQETINSRLLGIDTIITRIINEWNVPGCAIAIVEKNKTLYLKGFGYSDLDKKRMVNAETIFPIASCTKSFTASLIGLLCEEEKIDLDKPANDYLPLLKFYDPLLTARVTPRDMMTHITGIPRHDISWYGFYDSPRDSLVKIIQYFQTSAGYKEKFQYNNYMYVALGAMAEHVAGETWEKQIKDRFFIPLEMSNSLTGYKDLNGIQNIIQPHAITFQMEPMKIPFENADNMGPCGSIYSNAIDMANWLIVWINGGKYKNKTIIPEDFYKQATTVQWVNLTGTSLKIENLGYGFGWNIALYQGHYSVSHGGSGEGSASLVLFLPNDSLGMVIFINSRSSPVPMILANHITDQLLNLPYNDWSKQQLISFKNQQKQYESDFFYKRSSSLPQTHELSDYCGVYSNPGYGKITVFQKGDSLIGQYGILKLWLKHNNYDSFRAILYKSEDTFGKIDVFNRPTVFHQNSEGGISELTVLLERSVDPIIFKKIK